jgi:hypothetical protein
MSPWSMAGGISQGVTNGSPRSPSSRQARTELFVEVRVTSPFLSQREEIAPMAGDPVRWAKLDEEGLHVFSFVVLPNGRYELQVYTR